MMPQKAYSKNPPSAGDSPEGIRPSEGSREWGSPSAGSTRGAASPSAFPAYLAHHVSSIRGVPRLSTLLVDSEDESGPRLADVSKPRATKRLKAQLVSPYSVLTDPSAQPPVSPVRVASADYAAPSSPHTFVSTYEDELWNRAGIATTSEEEDDEEEEASRYAQGRRGSHSSSSGSSTREVSLTLLRQRLAPRLALQNFESDSSSLSSQEDDDGDSHVDAMGLIAIGIPDPTPVATNHPSIVDCTAVTKKPPPASPRQVTQEAVSQVVAQNVADEEAKAKNKAANHGGLVARRRAPLPRRSVATASSSRSSQASLLHPSDPKETDFGSRRRQRLQERSLPTKPAAATRATAVSTTTSMRASVAALEDDAMLKKRAAVPPMSAVLIKKAPPKAPPCTESATPLENALASRRTRSGAVLSLPSSMDGAARKKEQEGHDDDDDDDDESSVEGPQLATFRAVSVRGPDVAVQQKMEQENDNDHDEVGPTLAAPTAIQEEGPGAFNVARSASRLKAEEDYDEDEEEDGKAGPQLAQPDDFVVVSTEESATVVGTEVMEVQAGLVVQQGQAGAFAVEGFGAQTNDDDSDETPFDPTSSSDFVEEHESEELRQSLSNPSRHDPALESAAPFEAQLYETEVVEAEVYVEPDIEDDDPKLLRRLRTMQATVLCSSLIGVAFVLVSVIAGFGGKPFATEIPRITGWTAVGDTIFGPETKEPQTFFGLTVALTGDGRRIAAAAPGTDDGNDLNVGAVHLWEQEENTFNSTWKFRQSLPGPGPNEIALSSLTMNQDGSRIAIGYPFYAGGQVQVFDEGQGWQQEQVLTLEGNADGNKAWFGFAVDMTPLGDFLAVGSPLDTDGEQVGSARVYSQSDDGTWLPIGRIMQAEGPSELFGWSISLVQASNLRVAIGGPSFETDTGLVRVYEWVGSDWVQVGETLTGTTTLDRFGEACALSTDGTILAIGVRGSPFEAGEVRIFRDVQGTWVPDPQIIQGDQAGDGFGSALSFSQDGNTLAIGGPGDNEFGADHGHIEVWRYDGNLWERQGSSIGGSARMAYGTSVSLSADGRRVVGGGPEAEYDGSVPASGSFRVYDRDDA